MQRIITASLRTCAILLAAMALFVSCGTREGDEPSPAYDVYDSAEKGDRGDRGDGYAIGNGVGDGQAPAEDKDLAGIVTAGEWCDLHNWAFWSGLMLGDEYSHESEYWQFYTNNRIAVRVTDAAGTPLAGIGVELQRNGTTLWQTVTDNHGEASTWLGLHQKDSDTDGLSISLDGQPAGRAPVVCPWDSVATQYHVNHYVVNRREQTDSQADIAFVVDATGSMGDEIAFLKSDLADIINRSASLRPEMTIRTAALFYRDEGDAYITRHDDFTDNVSQTAQFVNQQQADGGGDYPEAVHTALERMLQDLSWNTNARTRIAFIVLDAPAHYESDVLRSLHNSIQQSARMGIRLIPVAASGVDKDTEFMLRFFAIATGGTYVFITNDSGVGLDHIAASVGDYEVEKLNELIIRLIAQYTE